jgi:hypothetical protein
MKLRVRCTHLQPQSGGKSAAVLNLTKLPAPENEAVESAVLSITAKEGELEASGEYLVTIEKVPPPVKSPAPAAASTPSPAPANTEKARTK